MKKSRLKFLHSKFRISYSSGFSMVEMVVGLGILAVAFSALFGTYRAYLKAALKTTDTLKAAYLLEEGLESVRLLRDTGFTANIAPLASGTSYYLAWSGGTWKSTTSAQTIDGFSRSFRIASIYRDASQDIASSGTLDNNTKKVDMMVAWTGRGATTTETISTYLSNILNN
ncbi:MAG TPA: type II secretion system protein [Candidatus Paceibacterota bacterium]